MTTAIILELVWSCSQGHPFQDATVKAKNDILQILVVLVDFDAKLQPLLKHGQHLALYFRKDT